MNEKKVRLAVFDSHPIQYFSQIWRKLAQRSDLELVVYYFSDHSIRGGIDPGFGVPVAWDTPLTEGYEHRFVTRDADTRRFNTVGMPDAKKLLHEGGFDAVLIHGYRYLYSRQVVRAARALGIGTILRGDLIDIVPYGGRSIAKKLARDLYLRWFYRYIDAYCCCGVEVREHLMRRGISAERMFFTPYTIDEAVFEKQKREFTRKSSRAELGIPNDHLVLLFCGKLWPIKSPLTIVRSLEKLPDISKVSLLMVGEGELRGEVEAAARPLLDGRLRITGFVNQSQLGKYYTAGDVLVLPSESESWGVVVNEAMEFGLPAILSHKVACRRDLVIEGETGFSFTVGDADGLARCIQRFLDDPTLAARLGRNAAEHIRKYSLEAAVNGIVQAAKFVARSKTRV